MQGILGFWRTTDLHSAKMEEKLIIAVTAHPELYDVSCPLYKDRRRKDQAWVSISQELREPSKVFFSVLLALHHFFSVCCTVEVITA